MRKIRMGMVGGGQGAFIGEIHRMAARLDGQFELVCGAFSADPFKSLVSGKNLYLAHERCYASYEQMFIEESKLDESVRMDVVVIVTPNHLHYPVAKMALEYGFHVISDKPATINLAQAVALKQQLLSSDLLYGLTHTYNGYPMVKEAKHRIASGELGTIRKVLVEYSQGWLSSQDDEDSKQAAWRLDPQQSGISCCVGDIGVHAANLAEYVSGLSIEQVCANLSSNVEGRVLDDDASIMLNFNSGAHGVLLSSQIAIGEENRLTLRIYGDKASLEWSQMEPNSLIIKRPDATSVIRTGVGAISPLAAACTRTPAGHPEGYIEAFANIYKQFAAKLNARLDNLPESAFSLDLPGIDAAITGMAFIEGVVSASQGEAKWHKLANTELGVQC